LVNSINDHAADWMRASRVLTANRGADLSPDERRGAARLPSKRLLSAHVLAHERDQFLPILH
jgi:hypothetical protein